MAHDWMTYQQQQLILRVLPEELRVLVHEHVSGAGGLDDVHIFRDEEQPDPPFFPACNERMVFQLGGKRWAASLVDLPCPVETHRTFDRVTTFKSSDVSQVLIVYRSEKERDNAEADARSKQGPYFGNPSGLTPPTSGIMEGRFSKTRSQLEQFPRHEVTCTACAINAG